MKERPLAARLSVLVATAAGYAQIPALVNYTALTLSYITIKSHEYIGSMSLTVPTTRRSPFFEFHFISLLPLLPFERWC